MLQIDRSHPWRSSCIILLSLGSFHTEISRASECENNMDNGDTHVVWAMAQSVPQWMQVSRACENAKPTDCIMPKGCRHFTRRRRDHQDCRHRCFKKNLVNDSHQRALICQLARQQGIIKCDKLTLVKEWMYHTSQKPLHLFLKYNMSMIATGKPHLGSAWLTRRPPEHLDRAEEKNREDIT